MEIYYQLMDLWLMPVYRFPDAAILGFYSGTVIIAMACVLGGDAALNIVLRLDHQRLTELTAEVTKLHNLSIAALEAGDGDSYRACNKLANEAFGRLFFLQAAWSMASLWPLPFALAWLQYRFGEVDFPLVWLGWRLNYFGVFLIMYILVRIIYKRLRPRLPFFRKAHEIFQAVSGATARMRSFTELLPAKRVS
ncbi:MAG: hypothetical protein HQK55_05630 [Deltaproteobacteria bacterium]|nr:hypothetical protein [Deltaproteobacteria bacterium]